MPDTPAIRIDRVSKTFRLGDGRELTALTDIDLSIAPGEFVALLGPSGCGKSTILRLVAALEEATAGRITIEGRAPAELCQSHRLGVAFQDHALLPWLDIEANVSLPFHLAGRSVDGARVKDMIALVGLAGFEKARPKQLSGGMRQRASIARALILEPEVLLLDEPFGALDAVTRRQMNVELQRIWSRHRITTLLVTHSVDEALFLADRVVVMSGRPGRVILDLPAPFARPRAPAVMREPVFHDLVDRLTEALEPEGAHP
ncbi:MAG: nitrate/sulfonate/bicarbonate transporter ATPase [Proteobacteria bacterium]|nr:nitrate/sulfonate/bicarbonate transporter ATPase [Pseudomonadota bacterium]